MASIEPPQVEQVMVDHGPAEARFAPGDGATLSLLLVGENEGTVAGCGCEAAPRGGLPRVATLIRARRAVEPEVPALLVHGGGWLSARGTGTTLDPTTLEQNAAVHRALGELRFDALATTWRDLPGVASGPHPGMVSATHRTPSLPVLLARTIEAGGVRVVVTSVSREGPPWLLPEGTEVRDPVEALRAVERADTDLFVVLAYGLSERVDALALEPGVDVVVDTSAWTGIWEPRVVGGAVVVRTRDEALTADELRLWIDEGHVVRAVDRVIPLGADLAEDPRVARHADR